jgi:hypothetical protein
MSAVTDVTFELGLVQLESALPPGEGGTRHSPGTEPQVADRRPTETSPPDVNNVVHQHHTEDLLFSI